MAASAQKRNGWLIYTHTYVSNPPSEPSYQNPLPTPSSLLPLRYTRRVHRVVAPLQLRQALEDERVQNLGEVARLIFFMFVL